MSFMWLVYLFSTLSSLGAYLTAITIIAAIMAALFIIVNLVRWADVSEYTRNADAATASALENVMKGLKCMAVAAMFGFIPVMLPSEKTMYMMVAAGAAQTVVDNAQVNDVAREGMDVVKQFLIKEKERLMSYDEKKK